MKKWVITGAALALTLQMGSTAFAADSGVFLARNMQEGIVWCHRYGQGDTCRDGLGCGERHLPGCAGRHLPGCADGRPCVGAAGDSVGCILKNVCGTADSSTGGQPVWGNGYAAGGGWEEAPHSYADGTGAGNCAAADPYCASGNCPVVDGCCRGWTDGDGDGLCDRCGNPVFRQNTGQLLPDTSTGVAENVEASSESQVIETEEPAVYGVETQSIIYDGGNGGYNAGNGGYGCPSGHHGEGCGNSGSGHHGRGHHR